MILQINSTWEFNFLKSSLKEGVFCEKGSRLYLTLKVRMPNPVIIGKAGQSLEIINSFSVSVILIAFHYCMEAVVVKVITTKVGFYSGALTC